MVEMTEKVLTGDDFNADELARLASECFLSVEDYLGERNCPHVRQWSTEKEITSHEWIREIALSKKQYFDDAKQKKHAAKDKLKAAGKDHFFLLLNAKGELIFERTEISESDRNHLLDDFHRNGARAFYLEGSAACLTDLDVGTKVFLRPDSDVE